MERLAAGCGGLFLLRLFFLFFGFVFVANELEDGHLSVVPDTVAGMDDTSVAAGSIREFGSDLAEKLLRDGRQHDVGSRLTPRLQRVTPADGDHFLRHRTRRFCARQRGCNPPVLEQVSDKAAQRGAAGSTVSAY